MTILRKLPSPIRSYARWLHLRWPAEIPEALPESGPGGTTSIPGVRIAGDLLGVPLLKFAADSGARAVQAFLAEKDFLQSARLPGRLDLAIVGGGVAGLAAALEAKKAGLAFVVYEASEPFATIVNFTNGKPIFTYPPGMKPLGDVQLTARNKEALLTELQEQASRAEIPFETHRVERVLRRGKELELRFADSRPPVQARRVLICIGRSGDHYKLNVPGEDLDKVHNRLFDPNDYAGKKVLVVGGGDSALEAALSLYQAGADVQLSYRGAAFYRPKKENIEKAESLLAGRILYETEVSRIEPDKVILKTKQGERAVPNEAVFVFIGREAPVDFFRRTGVEVRGHWTLKKLIVFVLTMVAVVFIYRWKTENSEIADLFLEKGWFPNNIDTYTWDSADVWTRVLQFHAGVPGFYYELLYTLVILVFGLRRIRRYDSPYIRWQTISLILIQIVPLFLLPYFILPLLGQWGMFDSGVGAWLADQLFPVNAGDGHREYWRSVGLILAWPLFIWNVFTPAPNALWLAIALVQTFIVIPWLVYRYGKGAYCGWICSCGALAETLGDAHRSKMPHGPGWNRLNLAGQVILLAVFAILLLRILAWTFEGHPAGEVVETWFAQSAFGFSIFGLPFNYSAVVDYFLSGILGLGLYFHFSGRTWCRFFCPLAALMHIYARFSRFRIFADKDKCISCNVCSSVCHQGIDIMNFANKGLPMEDPQCVRCSACVYNCPTGTLSFGRIGTDGKPQEDNLRASPVRLREE